MNGKTGNISKEIEGIKKTQTEILVPKNTTKIKYSLDELNGRM